MRGNEIQVKNPVKEEASMGKMKSKSEEIDLNAGPKKKK